MVLFSSNKNGQGYCDRAARIEQEMGRVRMDNCFVAGEHRINTRAVKAIPNGLFTRANLSNRNHTGH